MQLGFTRRHDGGMTGRQMDLPISEPSPIEKFTRERDAKKQPPSDDLWAHLEPEPMRAAKRPNKSAQPD